MIIDVKINPRGKSTFFPKGFPFEEQQQDKLRVPRLARRKVSKRYSSPESEDSPKRKRKVSHDLDFNPIRNRSSSLSQHQGKDCNTFHQFLLTINRFICF